MEKKGLWLLKVVSGWAGRGLGFLLGALAVLGQAPFHLWPIFILSTALLYGRLYAASRLPRPARAGFSVGLWWGLGYFAAGTFWVGSAFIARGPSFVPLMPFMVGGMAVLLALFWAFAGAFYARFAPKGFGGVLFFTASFFIAEFLRGHVLGGFPWNLPGYIFEAGSRPSQMARWINIYGLSWIVLFVSAALGQFLLGLVSPALKFKQGLGLALCVLVGLFGVGHLRLKGAQLDTYPDILLRLVSVPFSQADKMDSQKSAKIIDEFIEASVAPGLENLTHVIWPEGAINGRLDHNSSVVAAFGQALAERDTTPPIWMFTALEFLPDWRLVEAEGKDAPFRYYNAAHAITFDQWGRVAARQSDMKWKLVPFGEYIPFVNWMSDRNVPLVSTNLASISAGPPKKTVRFSGLPPFSVQICYEIIFPGLTPRREIIDEGVSIDSKFILNQSNDGWFGAKIGPAQHANIARYRAIETGTPVIRVAANGTSGEVDPYGRIYTESAQKLTSYQDVPLLKPLYVNRYVTLTTGLWLLISVTLCAISIILPRYGVGLFLGSNRI